MLVFDVANQLFHDVLHGQDARRASKFVHNDGQVPLPLLEPLEHVIRGHGFWDHERGVQDGLDGGGVFEQVPRVHVPNGLINVLAVDNDFAEAFRDEQFAHFFQGSLQIDSDYLVAWNQAVAGEHFVELQCVLHDLQLVLQLLLGFHSPTHFADEMVQVGGAQLLVVVIAFRRPPDESDGEIAQPNHHQTWKQEQVVDGDQWHRKELQPKVGIAVEQGFGNELSHHQDDQGRDQRLHGQHQYWLRCFRPVAHPKEPVADERPGFQSTKHQGQVVANQHGGDEELRAG